MVNVNSQVLASKQQTRRRGLTRAQRRAIGFYAFISPWLIGLVLLGILPVVIGFLTSLTNYDGLNVDTVKWTGLANYQRAFRDPDFGFSASRTLLWAAINTPAWLILSFLLATVLNQKLKAEGIFRLLLYLPSVIPLAATIWVWRILLDNNTGLVNQVLGIFQPGAAIRWLSDYSLVALSTISVWAGLGAGMVLFLAGLQGIPEELKEAAKIDGANGSQVFWHVTLPLMTPVIFFQLILALIGAFQALAVPLAMGGGGAQLTILPRESYLYMIHIYRQIFVYQRFGYGMALLWMLIVVILILTLLLVRSSRRWVHYEMAVEEEGK